MINELEANFSFGKQPTMTANFTLESGTGTKDHDKLTNRDIPNQHPISAIAGLEEQLESIDSGIETETNRAEAQEGVLLQKFSSYRTSANQDIIDDEITASVAAEAETRAEETQQLQNSINSEQEARQLGDNDLQGQIDALSAASDVKDIVGTYQELQAYDISTLGDNDIIKVLVDSTHENATGYYRWKVQTSTFFYIGSEGPYATPAEVSSSVAEGVDEAKGYTDNKVLTLATSSALTAETNARIADVAQLQSDLEGKQDIITDLAAIRTNAQAGKAASETIATYGNIVTHNTSEFQSAGDYATITELNAKANDSDVVHLSGAETISGVKTFTGGSGSSTTAVSLQTKNALAIGDATQTAYTGIYNHRKCADDGNKVNTAGFLVNKDGTTKFNHKTGTTTAAGTSDDYSIVFGKGKLVYGDGRNGEVYHDIFKDDTNYSKLETNNKQIIGAINELKAAIDALNNR